MKNFTLLILILVLAIFATACNNKSGTNNASNSTPDFKKDVQPVADKEIAVIELENSAAYGTIKIELYSNIAPKAVARFKELAKEGFYNGIAFHRINQSVIQVGDASSKAGNSPTVPGEKPKEVDSGKPNVEAEFSDIKYDAGIVGAARLPSDFNSANSQFFITLKREPGFDNQYTVFGKVIEGMNNARTIAGAPKNGERPVDDIRIKEIKIQPKQ
jgi:cyclophilin family peptidyl-prolyl cis-trans isomerase